MPFVQSNAKEERRLLAQLIKENPEAKQVHNEFTHQIDTAIQNSHNVRSAYNLCRCHNEQNKKKL